MKYRSILAFLFVLLFADVQAQDMSLYEKQWFIQYGDTLPYRILLPENYDAAKTYPLIVFTIIILSFDRAASNITTKHCDNRMNTLWFWRG